MTQLIPLHHVTHCRLAIATTVLTGLVVVPSAAQAAILTPGSSVGVEGTTVAARPELAGLVIQDDLKDVTIGGVTLRLQDRVVRSNLTNQLEFTYRLINNTGSAVTLNPFTVARQAFTGFSTDVLFALDGLGSEAPETASRSADGSQVSFVFDNTFTLNPGGSTRFFGMYTDATQFNGAGVGQIGQFTFSTAQPIPTPALLPGLLGLGLGIVRKRNARTIKES